MHNLLLSLASVKDTLNMCNKIKKTKKTKKTKKSPVVDKRQEMNEYIDGLVGAVPEVLQRYDIRVGRTRYRYGSKKLGDQEVAYVEFVVSFEPNVQIGVKLACHEIEACMNAEDKEETFLKFLHTIVQDVLARGFLVFQLRVLNEHHVVEEAPIESKEVSSKADETSVSPEIGTGEAVFKL